MRIATRASIVLALVLVGVGIGRASDRDETTVVAQVTSAAHELEEGYFSLGEAATVVARPGSDLHRFLAVHRGKKIRMVLSEADGRELSQLRRSH